MNDPVIALSAPSPPPKKGKGKRMLMLVLLAGIICMVLFVLFSTLTPPPRSRVVEVAGQNNVLAAQLDSLTERVKMLEARVQTLSAPLPASAPSAPSPVPEEPKVDAATAAGLAHVQSDMVSLSAALSALQTEVKATGAVATEARESSAALIASVVASLQVRAAAEAGRSFTDDLAQLREVSKNDPVLQAALAKLEPYAAAGAPTLAALRDELMQREPVVAVAIAKGNAQNWWQRVVAELQGLITVRPVHGGEGDALEQVENALSTSGAAAALVAFHDLPADAQHSLGDWKTRLEARQHIDEALAAIAARFTNQPIANPSGVKAP